jgi:hypothetical protein
MDNKDYNTKPAKPGNVLEPADLETAEPGMDMQKKGYYEGKEDLPQPTRGRKGPEDQHPTAALDVGQRGGKPGNPASKPHPTAELNKMPRSKR